MNNPNLHYCSLVENEDFIDFLSVVDINNKVMLSEQNSPDDLDLKNKYTIHKIHLNHSLQYRTQTNSKEIIAVNY